MRTNIKRLLLLANIILLMLICFFVIKAVNGRAAEIAAERISNICDHVVTQIDAGNMSLAQAADYATKESSNGDYAPTINVFKNADGIVLETNDSSVMVNILKKKESEFVRINCSQLAGS
jgi:hypothetical protein